MRTMRGLLWTGKTVRPILCCVILIGKEPDLKSGDAGDRTVGSSPTRSAIRVGGVIGSTTVSKTVGLCSRRSRPAIKNVAGEREGIDQHV